MKSPIKMILAASIFGVSVASSGAELFSPPLPVIFATNKLVCGIINVSDKTRIVSVQALNGAGVQVGEAFFNIAVAPGNVAATEVSGNLTPIHCKFSVPDPQHNFRASAMVVHPQLGTIAALPAD